MTYGYIEDLKFAIEVFDEGGNLLEVLARLRPECSVPERSGSNLSLILVSE